MITRKEYKAAQLRSAHLIGQTGIFLRDDELRKISVADFGLSDLDKFGAQILTLVDTQMIAAKLIAMFPHQILPEHWHPKIGAYAGKEETLRVEWGELYFYQPGERTLSPKASIPGNKLDCFKNWHEMIMRPGDQVTLAPVTPHWFQAGSKGAVVWSISTKALDLQDEFTDPQIRRETFILENNNEQ